MTIAEFSIALIAVVDILYHLVRVYFEWRKVKAIERGDTKGLA
jgi:mannose/fructose/N-acetylgalactosamine-specific phosphotransferase system component IIC